MTEYLHSPSPGSRLDIFMLAQILTVLLEDIGCQENVVTSSRNKLCSHRATITNKTSKWPAGMGNHIWWAPESLDSKTGSIWIPCNKSGERLSCIDDNLRMGLHQGSGPRNLGFKTPLDGHYFWNWTQAWKLVSQTMSILLSEDASQFDRKVMPH